MNEDIPRHDEWTPQGFELSAEPGGIATADPDKDSAQTWGLWGVHRDRAWGEWRVTHLPTGRSCRHHKTQHHEPIARLYAECLDAAWDGWAEVTTRTSELPQDVGERMRRAFNAAKSQCDERARDVLEAWNKEAGVYEFEATVIREQWAPVVVRVTDAASKDDAWRAAAEAVRARMGHGGAGLHVEWDCEGIERVEGPRSNFHLERPHLTIDSHGELIE